MCYLYMRMEEEMDILSTYVNEPLRADVVVKDGVFGIVMYDKYGDKVRTEYFKGHSEYYAEDAAENYVFGIKTL